MVVTTAPMLWIAQSLCLVVLLLAAAWSDWRTRRIPNGLTVAGAGAAMALHLLAGGDAWVGGLLGLGLALAVGVPLFAVGAFGGGDVKLLAAVAAFMGPRNFLGAFLAIAVIGGVLVLLDALRRRTVIPLVTGSMGLLKSWFVLGPRGVLRAAPADAASIPYGVPIAIGALVWWFSGWSL